jgi:domain of unknown function (DUF1887)
MLKTTALCKVETTDDTNSEAKPLVSDVDKQEKIESLNRAKALDLLKNMENIIMYPSGAQEYIPPRVVGLAVKMMENHELIKDIIIELRQYYTRGQKEFEISLAEKDEVEKLQIVSIFKSMSGLVSCVRHVRDTDTLKGFLIMTQKAQKFITGQYLEIGVEKTVKNILNDWAKIHNTSYEVYRNVKIEKIDGTIKNEFDVVIVLKNKFYIIECKSGRNFYNWNRLTEIAIDYGIIPKRCCLVDSFASDDDIECIEYFCEYNVSNINSLHDKIIKMITYN